jgi:hypothetical protein
MKGVVTQLPKNAFPKRLWVGVANKDFPASIWTVTSQTACRRLCPVMMASLCPGQENHAMCELGVQVANSGLSPQGDRTQDVA